MKDNNEVMSKNEFVKKEQEVMKTMMGNRPGVKPEAAKFDAYMLNNGEGAQKFARDLTKGIDEKAFPVK